MHNEYQHTFFTSILFMSNDIDISFSLTIIGVELECFGHTSSFEIPVSNPGHNVTTYSK